MRELTYNEAALEAIAEEMRRDPKIFYMSTDAIGAAAARSSATSGSGRRRSPRRRFTGIGDRRGRLRLPPDRRLAAGDVLLCRDGPDRQSGREDPLHVRRPGDVPDPVPRLGRRRRPGRGAALAVALFDVHECRRAEDVPALDALRHEGAAEDRDPRQQPGHLVRVEPADGGARGRCRRRTTRSRSARPTSSARAAT